MTNKDTNQSEENYFNELFKHPETIQRDENQNIFIDRDPTYFRYILNYLRNFGDLEKCFFPDEEKELKELIEETKFYGLTNFTNFLSERNFIFLGSHILNLELSSMLSSFFPNKKWKSVYRATRDGFDALSFHSCCDGIGPSIVLILTTNGWIFGGYTSKPWRSHGGFFKDEECFLFSLVTPKRQKKYKLNLLNKQASEYAVFYSNEKSACFGADALHCVNDQVFTHLGETFECDEEFGFCGKFSSCMAEMEVFVQNKK
eukprot:gene4124-7410_t